MKIVSFIGYKDKSELILYVCKNVKLFHNAKVLFIDSYTTQKCRTIIPAIVNDKHYITTFEDIDIAIGFNGYEEIFEYCEEYLINFEDYDYVFLDVNSIEMCESYGRKRVDYSFLVTSYDKYDVIKSTVLLHNLIETNAKLLHKNIVNKVYCYTVLNTSDEKYIDHSFTELKIPFNEKIIHLPLDEGDVSVIIQNQYAEKILFKQLSKIYKNGIVEIASRILEEEKKADVERVFKNIERGG